LKPQPLKLRCISAAHTSAVYVSCASVVLLVASGATFVQDCVVEDIVTACCSSCLCARLLQPSFALASCGNRSRLSSLHSLLSCSSSSNLAFNSESRATKLQMANGAQITTIYHRSPSTTPLGNCVHLHRPSL